jgi:cleavage and polyadenylation specificity factor subunit 3
MGVVDVKHTREDELMLEWESSVTTDMIADSTLALILGIESSPASVKCTLSRVFPENCADIVIVTTSPHSHSHADDGDDERMQQSRYLRLASFLESHFGEAEIYLPDSDNKDTKDLSEEERDDPAIIVKVDELVARVNLVDLVWATIFSLQMFDSYCFCRPSQARTKL